MSKQVPPSRESSVWSDVLGVLDKLSLKDSITRGFIFRPPKPSYTFKAQKSQDDSSTKQYKFKPTEAMDLSEHEDVQIQPYKLYRERKGELHMVPVIMVGNKKKRSDFLMIYSHGNSCDLGTIYGSVINLSLTLNIDVLAYDYTGYGISPNKPSEKSTYKDLESVLSFAVGELNHPLDKIVLCGFSLGSGPTIEMATRFQSIPFIVLFAPLTSCLGVWTDGKGKGFNHDIYDNIGKMHKVWSDMLIIHGKDDQVVTSRHSQQLMKAYLSSHSTRQNRAWLLQISKADHENLLFGLEFAECSYRSSFISYFQRLTHKNHTNSVFMGAINDDKEKDSAEDNRELIGTTTFNCYDGIDEESIKDMCNLIKRTSVEHDPESTDFESSEWNSSIILGDSPCDLANPSFSGRFTKYETEHLKDLFTKISVNKVPEKWRKSETAVFRTEGTEALLFRKTLL